MRVKRTDDVEASPHARKLSYWVKIVNHAAMVKMNRLLRPSGLTTSSWYVLYNVSKAKRIPQKKLQAELGIESGSMAIIVDELVRKGWLLRAPDERDRRANYLELTPKGATRWKSVPDIVSLVSKEMMRDVTEEQEAGAIATLRKCWANLSIAD
jgi:DNA-binding MarR family transcriptional regulator